MNFATLRRYVTLGALIAFVAYFGVWQLYQVMYPALGAGWAAALGIFAALGLCVIALVGAIMVHTRSLTEKAGPPAGPE